jgi:16S rRNA (adenine1518-N6/adenine1519-N6)-dimethyltransferase
MRAKKSLGQNFLQDETVVDRIVDALELRSGETVVEIGPGKGALTKKLIGVAGRVVAIEFDRDMLALLRERFGSSDNFYLINDDALSIDLAKVLGHREGDAKARLVANLPYNISTPILQRLIEQRHLFSSLVLMFQREVVERITALPGTSARGFLTVLVENAFDAECLFDVPPKAFQPVPKVWSSVVRLTPKASSIVDEPLFRRIASLCFMQKRKNILNNLRTAFDDAAGLLTRSGIDGRRRAETLTLPEWSVLTDTIAKKTAGSSIDVRPQEGS